MCVCVRFRPQDSAWDELARLPDSVFSGTSPAGNGNSRSNAMYWCATRGEQAQAEVAVPRLAARLAALGAAPAARRAAFGLLAVALGAVVVVGVVTARAARAARRAPRADKRRERDVGDSTSDALLQRGFVGDEYSAAPSRGVRAL